MFFSQCVFIGIVEAFEPATEDQAPWFPFIQGKKGPIDIHVPCICPFITHGDCFRRKSVSLRKPVCLVTREKK